MKVRYKARAIRQLHNVERYIAQDNPAAAARVVKTIRAAIDGLRDYPLSHRAGEKMGTWELIVPGLPYIVVYRVGARHVDILGVFHAARHPSVRSKP